MPLISIILLCLMLPAAALSGGVDAPTPSDTDRVRLLLADAQPFSGVATPTSATFLLAIPKRAVWEWNLPDTPDDVAEYLWEVVVNSDGKEYRFGFSLWRMPGDSYQAGDLEGLLRFGQSDLWLTRPEGNGASVVRGVRIRVEPHETGQILVLVEGRESIEMLLSSRPKTLECSMSSPYEKREAIINMSYLEISDNHRDSGP